jgi:hypothetical protein
VETCTVIVAPRDTFTRLENCLYNILKHAPWLIKFAKKLGRDGLMEELREAFLRTGDLRE